MLQRTMPRRCELTERCYQVRCYEELSIQNDVTRNDATKKRDTYESDMRAVLGLAASHLVKRLPSGTPIEGGQLSLIRLFLPASSLYPATDGGRGQITSRG